MGNLFSKTPNNRPESTWGYNPVSPTKDSQTGNKIGGLFLSSIPDPNGEKFANRLFLEVGDERKVVWFQETSFKIDGFSIFFRDNRDDRLTIVFTINKPEHKIDPIILKEDEFVIVSNKLVSWKKKKFLKNPVTPNKLTVLRQDGVQADSPCVNDFTSFMHKGTSTIQANRGNVQGRGVWFPISFPDRLFILYDETPTVSHDGASSDNVVHSEVALVCGSATVCANWESSLFDKNLLVVSQNPLLSAVAAVLEDQDTKCLDIEHIQEFDVSEMTEADFSETFSKMLRIWSDEQNQSNKDEIRLRMKKLRTDFNFAKSNKQ
jgi:hypothetical protein